MLSEIFYYEDVFKLAQRPGTTIYTGRCPWDLRDRAKIRDVIGQRVFIEGIGERTILAMETFSKLPGPGIGESIGLLVRDEDA